MFVSIPEPFDFALTLERIAALGPDSVNVVEQGRLVRAVGGRAVEARSSRGGVAVEPGGPEESALFAHMFGASFDVAGFVEAVSDEPVLGALVRALPGLRPLLVPEPFEMLVGAISAQQISLQAALAVRDRFVERFGVKVGPGYAFPARERVAAASQDELRQLGFSNSKARFVLEIARAGLIGESLDPLSDDAVVERLVTLPGVGRWTAEWFLSRHLGRGDVWPAGDLGVRRACELFLTNGDPVDESRARALGERFAPWRTLACTYLLAGLRRESARSAKLRSS